MTDISDDISELKLMFNTKGWGVLVSGIQEELEILKNSILSLEDNNKFQYCRGKAEVLQSILNYENKVSVIEQELSTEDDNADL